MLNDLDINVLAANFDYFKEAQVSSMASNDVLEKYKNNKEFMNLYNYIVTSEKDYILPSIIPLLDELLVNEDLLRELVNMWKDSEDEYVAYWMLKKYPYLMSKIETFEFTHCLYGKDLIKVISDIDEKSKIVLSVSIKIEGKYSKYYNECTYDYYEDVDCEGNSSVVLYRIAGSINFDEVIKINIFKVDGEKAIGKIPFCYFKDYNLFF